MYTVQEPPFNRHIIREEERINLLKSKAQHCRHTKFKIATWNIKLKEAFPVLLNAIK